MKVYLDTVIISSWINEDIRPEELEALERVLDAWQSNRIELCTSTVAREELAKVPEEHRGQHMRLYRLIKLVPIAPIERWGTGLSLMGTPTARTYGDPIYSQLRAILDEKDANHVFQAIKNGVNVFLTVDRRVVARRGEIQRWGMEVLKPSELLSLL